MNAIEICHRFWNSILIPFLLLVLILNSETKAADLVTAPRSDGASIPLRVYTPEASGCVPLAIISPGAGGTEKGYSYLADGLRHLGWFTVVVGHKESGPETLRKDALKSGLRDGLLEMVTNPDLHRYRLMDIEGTLQWAERLCKHPYKTLLGHSMGSITVMFEAGARNKIGVAPGQDPFDAYVAISPEGPGTVFSDHAWNSIHKPTFILTGTGDKGLEGSWEWRAKPYRDLPPGCKWLGIIEGATHVNFAGIGVSRKTEKLTLESVTAFLTGAREGNCHGPQPITGMKLETK